MKLFNILLWVVLPSTCFTQKLSQANAYFERYEYERAAAIYDSCAFKKPLPLEEFKRQAYSFYVTGNYDRTYELTDSLIRIKETEPFFHYAHAISCMARADYVKAKGSFEKYRTVENEFEVDLHIASCDSLMVWSPTKVKKLKNNSQNHSKANINGFKHFESSFVFHETGVDSSGALMELNQIDFSEVVLNRPYVSINDSAPRLISLPEVYQLAVVSSMVWLKSTNQVVMTIAEPASPISQKHAPHLYIGKLNLNDFTVTEIQPFVFSGWQDTSSCAYATVNDSENAMVFTRLKSGEDFSDLYVSRLNSGEWTLPTPISELNTPRDEFAPMFSGDSLLSFSSDGRPGYGGLDIFTVQVTPAGFGQISHLKAPYNSFHDDFNFTYLADSLCWFTSNRSGGKGDDDVYFVELDVIRPVIPIDSTDIFLTNIEKNWKDINIYFDFARFDLTKIRDLDTIVRNLSQFPECALVIEGHTDNIGTPEYNQHLGYFRADAVKKAFISLGVSEGQIKIESKGELDLPVDCGTACTMEQHALNRVAIVKLVVNRKRRL